MINYLENTILWGNSLLGYIYFLGLLILSFVAAKIVSLIFKKYFKKLTSKTKTKVDDIIVDSFEKPIMYSVFFVLIYFAFKTITLGTTITNIITKSCTAITIILITWGITKLVHSAIEIYWAPKVMNTGTNIDNNLMPVFKSLISWIIWIMSILFILTTFGINITSLVAGLGIGGLAIAFALQTVFADLFASFSIYLDRPFNIGDYIVIGNDSGTVKKIGLKSTRITTLDGDQLVVSNKELTESRIRNYKKMKKRRVRFNIGVEYGTSSEKLQKIPLIMKKIIDSTDNVEFGRAHFSEFGDFSLNFEIIMFIDNRDYDLYMDVQQKVNLGITKAFAKEKISIAFPTQTVFIKK